jgi:hypothetical protein
MLFLQVKNKLHGDCNRLHVYSRTFGTGANNCIGTIIWTVASRKREEKKV